MPGHGFYGEKGNITNKFIVFYWDTEVNDKGGVRSFLTLSLILKICLIEPLYSIYQSRICFHNLLDLLKASVILGIFAIWDM